MAGVLEGMVLNLKFQHTILFLGLGLVYSVFGEEVQAGSISTWDSVVSAEPDGQVFNF